MKREFVVIDVDGHVSMGGKDASEPETFKTFNAARSRAEELARLRPTHTSFGAHAIYPVASHNVRPHKRGVGR